MKNVIKLLERLGQDVEVRNALEEKLGQVANELALSPELEAALRSSDQTALSRYLGVNTNVCCMVLPSKEDGEEDQQEEDEKEAPDESEKSLHRAAG